MGYHWPNPFTILIPSLFKRDMGYRLLSQFIIQRLIISLFKRDMGYQLLNPFIIQRLITSRFKRDMGYLTPNQSIIRRLTTSQSKKDMEYLMLNPSNIWSLIPIFTKITLNIIQCLIPVVSEPTTSTRSSEIMKATQVMNFLYTNYG